MGKIKTVVGDPACEAMLEELRLKGIDTSDFGVFTSLRPTGAVRRRRPGRYLEELRYDTVRGRTELLRLKCTAAATPAESRTRPNIAPAPMPKSLQSNPREVATPGAVTVTKRALSPQIAR